MATTVKEAPRGAGADIKRYPIYLAGEWATSDNTLEIVNPYDGSVVGVTYEASQEQLERAIVAAQHAFETARIMPTFDRAALLEALARGLKARRDEFIRMIALEAGKPVRDATAEVDRGVFTLQTAAEEAKRIEGDLIPLDLLPSSKGRFGIVRRFPIGPIAGISPFNYPLNLALHKIAPAIAAGNTIVL
ncbi:MAG TPA: aldehyde dehydrogenase family protein, partial [Thermomicrobiales bacterium]|nr:aldehyde dehydrogenase family protein [Thermomicrobiales bacterium]